MRRCSDTEQWHYLSALTAYFSRAKYAVGFGSRPLRKKLFDTAVSYDINGYELDSFRELFLSLFSVGEGLSLANSFHASAINYRPLQGTLRRTAYRFPRGKPAAKQLNFDQTVTVIKFFLELDCRVLLLGGKDHQALSEDVSRKIGDGRLVNLVGQTSLPGAAAIIARTKLFVGTDSGLLHLACAVGVPTISVLGPVTGGSGGRAAQRCRPDRQCSLFTMHAFQLFASHVQRDILLHERV